MVSIPFIFSDDMHELYLALRTQHLLFAPSLYARIAELMVAAAGPGPIRNFIGTDAAGFFAFLDPFHDLLLLL